jgi:hypothetical protein
MQNQKGVALYGRVVLCLLLLAGTCSNMKLNAAVDEKIMQEAKSLRDRGEFEKSTRMLQDYLDQTTSTLEASEKRNIEFEIERMRRIRMDYRLTRDALMQQFKKRIPDFTEEEFNQYEREGKFDVQVIDGQKLYVGSSVSNLVLAVPELRTRDTKRQKRTSYRRLYAQMQQVKEAKKTQNAYLVCPQDFAVTYTLVVEPDAAPEGKTVRCWLPYLHMFPFQTDAYITNAEPAEFLLAPPEYAHRTAYFERTAVKGAPTTFSLSFIYRAWSRAYPVSADKVLPYRKDSPEYQYYTADRKPHLDLGNEELKRLSSEIVDGETNPVKIARRIYDWIAHNTIYQYAREYSTIENLSYYCGSRKAGDCGQHAMLFIALCRMNGIPARWQTGWESFEDSGSNMHDWSEIYFEPWGWVPVDADMAVNVTARGEPQIGTTHSQELVDYMFGNMDHYRLAVNSDFGMPLYPEKTDFRSETVDFQRGEVECDGKNLYFNKWDYSMDIEPISRERAEEIARQYIPEKPPLPPMFEHRENKTTASAGLSSDTRVSSSSAQTSSTAVPPVSADHATSAPAAAKPAPSPGTSPSAAATSPTAAVSPPAASVSPNVSSNETTGTSGAATAAAEQNTTSATAKAVTPNPQDKSTSQPIAK